MSMPGFHREPPPSVRAPAARRWRRRASLLALLSATVGCDRVTKSVATALLPEGRRISLLGDSIRLERIHNPGAFLGLGAGLGEAGRAALFTWGVAALVLVALVAALRARAPQLQAAGAALVAGGGIGNLWDRIEDAGRVTDFLNLGLGPIRTGIFNVADVALVAGVVLLAWPASPGRADDL
jgi:signal peptidase II